MFVVHKCSTSVLEYRLYEKDGHFECLVTDVYVNYIKYLSKSIVRKREMIFSTEKAFVKRNRVQRPKTAWMDQNGANKYALQIQRYDGLDNRV